PAPLRAARPARPLLAAEGDQGASARARRRLQVTSIASRPGPSSTLQAVRLDRRGLAREAGVEEEFLVELEQFGMLAEGPLFYGAAELEIVTSARDLADVG